MKRKPSLSREQLTKMVKAGINNETIISFFPVDPAGCECEAMIDSIQNLPAEVIERKKASKGILRCPKNKDGYKHYYIYCRNCEARIATLYAKDRSIGTDWCDLHYQSKAVVDKVKSDDKGVAVGGHWEGCFSVNIEPKTGRLGFECACGNDTRQPDAKGKEFGKRGSKFIVREIS